MGVLTPLLHAKTFASFTAVIVLLLGLTLFHGVVLAVYRLTLHPLARFPGPPLTAATSWYERILDIFCGPGQTFAFEIERMHQCYGPIVHITPDKIHVSDPAFFDSLYAGGSAVREKYPPAAHIQMTPESVFGTTDHSLHRRLRAAISPYFSRSSVLEDQGITNEKVELLCDLFRSSFEDGEVINIQIPLLAISTDIFGAHTLGPRGSMDLLRSWNKAVEWRKSILALLHWTPVVRQFSSILPFALELPLGLIKAANPGMGLVVGIIRNQREQARQAISEHQKLTGEEKARTNVFHTILSSALPVSDKDHKRMAQEAFSILTASSGIVARTMTAAMYHLHANPLTLRRLKEELKLAISYPYGKFDLLELERLPFLTAVLKESLRISALITTRAPLVAPTQALRYSNFLIPPNTPVSMTLFSLMLYAASFLSPNSFHPDRWLESNRDYKRNMSNFVPSHRGHRSCIGINLAWAEMYLTLTKLLRRFDFELFNVVRERNIGHRRDRFLGEPGDDTKGVSFRVLGMT